MEPKKNPRYDVHRKRNLIFNFSLALSLLIVISAFRIAVPYETGDGDLPRPVVPDVYVAAVPVTTHKEKLPPPAVKQPAQLIDLSRIKEAVLVSESSPDPAVDPDPEELSDPFSGLELPVEFPDDTTTFIFVEHKPEPVGGLDAFYKTLGKNLRYPKKAIRYNTTGTVYVEFVVERNGVPQRINVVRGIGNGCDEEAMRVIGLSRWNPGKQRGKPVKVKMVLPVVFRLAE